MNPLITIGLTGLALLALAAEGQAAIVYLTQQRFIRTQAFLNGDFQGPQFPAQGFSDFNQSWNQVFPQFTSGGAGSASASQVSRLLPDQILMDGTASATVNLGTQIEIDSRSEFHITFRLDAPSPYLIEHSHSTTADPLSSPANRLARARLMGPAGTLFDWQDDLGVPSTWPAGPASGVLPPGTYDLLVQAYNARASRAAPSTGSVSVSFHMSIPAPGGAGVLALGALGIARRSRRAGEP